MGSAGSPDLSRVRLRALDAADLERLARFECGDDDLRDFLVDDALRLQAQNVVRTYLALRGSDEIAGYVALMADSIVLQTREKKKLALGSQDHPVVPALKVARIAVATTWQGRGLGHLLMRFSAAMAFEIAERAGCRLLTLDAYPNAVQFYEKLGFIRNRSREYRDRAHPSMRLDLFAPDLPRWVSG